MLWPEYWRYQEQHLREQLITVQTELDGLPSTAAPLQKLSRRLPADLRIGVEDAALKAAINGDYVDVIGHVQDYLSARLTAPGK